jgi:hypothetical protein
LKVGVTWRSCSQQLCRLVFCTWFFANEGIISGIMLLSLACNGEHHISKKGQHHAKCNCAAAA